MSNVRLLEIGIVVPENLFTFQNLFVLSLTVTIARLFADRLHNQRIEISDAPCFRLSNSSIQTL